jgi:hypothetical protein
MKFGQGGPRGGAVGPARASWEESGKSTLSWPASRRDWRVAAPEQGRFRVMGTESSAAGLENFTLTSFGFRIGRFVFENGREPGMMSTVKGWSGPSR